MSDYKKSSSGLYVPKDDAYYKDNPWEARITSANKYYNTWSSRYKCRQLEDYFRGFQWKLRTNYSPTTNYNPYVINLIYSTIKIKLANLVFQRPKFLVSPNPGNANVNLDFAYQSAQLKEDVLNSIIRNPNTNFTKHTKRAARDSFFRFGVVEIGYANDWRNPQKEQPYLKSWDDPDIDPEKDKVVEENDVAVNERFYVKRIKPSRFRVCVSEATDLNDSDWCGYYDYYPTPVLMNTKGIDWPKEYSGGLYTNADYTSGYVGSEREEQLNQLYTNGQISKVWHIWDNVTHERLLLLEDDCMHELWSGDFTNLPLIDIRWDEELGEYEGFYPVPPVFQWLSPQDEINEAREQTRSYRRRFTRKFQAVKNLVDEEEKEKFASGPDGIIIEVKQADAIKAIDNPEMGPTSENALIIAKDDFNIISGTSAEARGQSSDRETATQAKLVDARSQIRESSEQLDFSVFLCGIGRQLLAQCQERLVEGLWIKYTSDPGAIENAPDPTQQQAQPANQLSNGSPVQGGMPQQAQPPAYQPQVYQYVSAQQIDDGYDYEVEFDVQNATPAGMQQQQQAFVSFLALLQNPMILMSPAMIREAAYRVGYRNEAIIKEAQQAALMHAKMQAAQMAGAGQEGNNTANSSKSRAAQMQTPGSSQIASQISNQLQ